MNDWLPIFKRSRLSLFILAGCLAFSLTFYFGSAYIRNLLTTDLAQKQSLLIAEQARLEEKQTDLANIQSHIEQYRTLQQQGLVGAATRENWVEQLIASRIQLRLPETLTYSLKPPAPLGVTATTTPEPASDVPTAVGPDGPLAHNLDIELRDIHEGELLSFLKTFQSKVHGRFRVQSCRLADPSSTGLAAQCSLRFFTLPQSTKPPAEAQ